MPVVGMGACLSNTIILRWRFCEIRDAMAAEGGADGSLEKLLGNIGLGKVGKGIDWFFDTSTISGAKAWRLQEIPGEADATRFRGGETTGDDLEEMLQDQISSRCVRFCERVPGSTCAV